MVNPVKLGLKNMQRLYQLLDRPVDRIPIIHVTGTNGKVCCFFGHYFVSKMGSVLIDGCCVRWGVIAGFCVCEACKELGVFGCEDGIVRVATHFILP